MELPLKFRALIFSRDWRNDFDSRFHQKILSIINLVTRKFFSYMEFTYKKMLWYRTWIGEVRVYLYIHIICVSIITMRKSNVIGNNINNYYHHYCCGCLFFFLSHFLYLFSLSFFLFFVRTLQFDQVWPHFMRTLLFVFVVHLLLPLFPLSIVLASSSLQQI